MRGRLETLGYTQAEAIRTLDAFVAQPYSYIVDIRYKPYSWNPTWNRESLKARFGRRYVHLAGLGNLNYADKHLPIELADPEHWIEHLASELDRGCSYLLLCACKHYERCHRKVVYERVVAAWAEGQAQQHKQAVGVLPGEDTLTYHMISLWEQ